MATPPTLYDLLKTQQTAQGVPALPPIAPMMGSAPILPPPVMPTVVSPHIADQERLNSLVSSGSGVSQIHNPYLRGLARTADVLGTVLAPRVLAAIPGTTLHHQQLIGQQQGIVANDQQQDAASAGLQDQQAQADQRRSLAEQEQAKATSLLHPKGGLLYDKNGSPIGYQDPEGKYYGPDDPTLDPGVREVLGSAQRKQPSNAFELWQQQNPKGTAEQYLQLSHQEKDATLQQQYLDAVNSGDHNKARNILKVIHDTSTQPKIDIHQAAERPETTGTWIPGFDANKNPVLFNSKTGEVKPNKVGFAKTTAAGQKIGLDEQKRADLAENLNENINALEEIAPRRPELFGPVNGRITGGKMVIGTDDPDISQLQTIEHQLGMVAQGAHGMRSAEGIESAAHSLTNGYHNTPKALTGALEAARSSVGTFLGDAQNPGKAREGGAVKVGQQVKLRNGQAITVKVVHPDGSFE